MLQRAGLMLISNKVLIHYIFILGCLELIFYIKVSIATKIIKILVYANRIEHLKVLTNTST